MGSANSAYSCHSSSNEQILKMLNLLFLLCLCPLFSARSVQDDQGGCVQLMVDFHQCVNREQTVFNTAVERGIDGKKHWLERKFCNFLTSVDNCGQELTGNCYTEEEATVWNDMNLAVILDQAESLLTHWDSEKCPVMKAHIMRMEQPMIDEGSNNFCNQVRTEFNACRKEASSEYVNAMRDGADGRPYWEARKMCNLETANLVDCPKILIGQCHTEEDVTKMNFWEVIGENSFLTIEAWDSEKCPAVKKQISHWKAVVRGEGSLYPESPSFIESDFFSFLTKVIAVMKKVFQNQQFCAQSLLDYHDCVKRNVNEDLDVIKSGPDGKSDWAERKFCNTFTHAEERCDKILSRQCFKEKDILMWSDSSLEVSNQMAESFTRNWNPEKCPIFMSYLRRKEDSRRNLSNLDDCGQARREHTKCSKKAMKEYTTAMLHVRYDGRPNFDARKSCNLATATTFECPKKLIGHCYTEEEVFKLSLLDTIDDELELDEGWDTEKCPAYKEHLARWKAVMGGNYTLFAGTITYGSLRTISALVNILSLAVD